MSKTTKVDTMKQLMEGVPILKYTPKIGHKKIWRFKIGQSKVSETDSKRIRGSIFHNLGFEAII